MKGKYFSIFLFIFIISNSYANQALLSSLSTREGHMDHIVHLHSLDQEVVYNIQCELENSQAYAIDFRFNIRLLPGSIYKNVSLNGESLPNNQGKLKQGTNKLTFDLLKKQSDNGHYNQFSIQSDYDLPNLIRQCVATTKGNKAKKGTKSAKVSGGYFLAYNDTNRKVTIGVGNFFPTEYNLKPNSYKTIFVSTDNQSIHIIK